MRYSIHRIHFDARTGNFTGASYTVNANHVSIPRIVAGSTRINHLTSHVEYLLSTATWAGSKCRNVFDHKVIVCP